MGRDMVIKRFEQSLNEKKIFATDLQNMLSVVRTDEELNLLFKGLNEFKPIPDEAIFNYSAQLMRLLYILNKTDLALELLLKEEEKPLLTSTACTIVGTKLYNEGRYNDILNITDRILEKKYILAHPISWGAEPKDLSLDATMLTFGALLKLGDVAALNRLKGYFQYLRSKKLFIPIQSIVFSVYLALKHNDTDFADQIFEILTNKKSTFAINLKLIILARTNLNEAVELLDDSRTILHNSKPIKLYRSTVNDLKEYIEKENNPELMSRFNMLVEDSISLGMFIEANLLNMHLSPIPMAEVSKLRLAREEKIKLKNNATGQTRAFEQFDRSHDGQFRQNNREFEDKRQGKRFGNYQQSTHENRLNNRIRGSFEQDRQSADSRQSPRLRSTARQSNRDFED